jgi:CBS domain-containing protein
MNAREVMTSPVVSATGDTPVRDIAQLLLQNHVSAVPILDRSGAPIGMVSEGDLIGRNPTEGEARREWWLALLAEGEALGPDFLSSLRRSERVASEVMSKPVITVGEDTDAGEIARTLATYRIKRVPVVRNGQVVGIVSRENLLRWLANEEHSHDSKPKEGAIARALGDALVRFALPHHETNPHPVAPMTHPDDTSSAAADFRRLAAEFENKEAGRREGQRHSAEEERQRQAAELIGKHISEESWRNLIHGARTAAEQGLKEFMLLRFPSQLCSDGGRAVNAPDPDWPATLRGEAAEFSCAGATISSRRVFILRPECLTFPTGCPATSACFSFGDDNAIARA